MTIWSAGALSWCRQFSGNSQVTVVKQGGGVCMCVCWGSTLLNLQPTNTKFYAGWIDSY